MRILGLDIGTTSVGFALIDQPEKPHGAQIIRIGVRIFPEGRNEKERTPRNKDRRDARLQRRQIRRRRCRKRRLSDILRKAGMLPEFDHQKASDWQKIMAIDPYMLRHEALSRPLQPMEIGRILYHLSKHRGYWSSRVDTPRTDEEEKDLGKVKQGISDLTSAMGNQTLGSYLAQLPTDTPKRGRYLGRDMVTDEYEQIWQAQAGYHPNLLTAEFKTEIAQTIFFQRPTFWWLSTLGRCDLEPDSPLAAKSSYLGQQFTLLQRINNFRLSGGNARPLSEAERNLLLAKLYEQKRITFAAIRKLFRPLWEADGTDLKTKFNFETDPNDKTKFLAGHVLEVDLRQIFGPDWASFPEPTPARIAQFQEQIDKCLRNIHYRQVTDENGRERIEIRRPWEVKDKEVETIGSLMSDFGLSQAQAEQVVKITPTPGWLRHSTDALKRLVPHMQAGMRYDQAADHEYPDRRLRVGGLARLPSRPSALADIRNPTVTRVLNEVRKVVNNIIAADGKPDKICIELARDVKLTPNQLSQVNKTNADNEKARKKAAEALTECQISADNRTIDKYLLWKECQETCPYTGDKIGFDALFRQNKFQVEHIFPRRSLDNRMQNKTLARTDMNLRKDDRSPYDAFGHSDQWPEMVERAKKLLPENKAKRFCSTLGPPEDMSERQLQDTAYAARAAKEFLLLLYPQVAGKADPVDAVAGRITGRLRKLWGLNRLLHDSDEKNRKDHRHHAVDAFVIAMTNRTMVQRMSELAGQDRFGNKWDFPPPWRGYRSDLESAIENIVPSFRVFAKTSGPIHQETRFGDTQERSGDYNIMVSRKSIETLTENEIKHIRDPAVKALIKQKINETGSLKAALARKIRLPKNGIPDAGPEIKKVRLIRKKQANTLMALKPKPKTFAEKTSLHHIALYEDGEHVAFTVQSRLEVQHRLHDNLPIVAPYDDQGRPLIFSLCRNDVLEHIDEHGEVSYVVVQKFSRSGQIFYKPATAALITEGLLSSRPKPFIEAGYRKVSVDPIGRIRRLKKPAG